MGKQKPKLGLIFVMVYAILVVAALTFAFIMVSFYTSKSEFAGVYIGVLTLPWSIFLSVFLDSLGMQDSISISIKMLFLIICAVLNAFILYWFGKKIEKNW